MHAFGEQYIYKLRQSKLVLPHDLSPLQHEELPWLTLVTCQSYNEASDTYKYRSVVRAVLVEVLPEISR